MIKGLYGGGILVEINTNGVEPEYILIQLIDINQ